MLRFMQAYSLDLRQRVVDAYEQGNDSIAAIAERFSVSVGFVKKMLALSRTTGDLAPRGHGGGRRASLTPQQRQFLGRKVRAQNDISLAELQAIMEEQEGVRVHVSTICRALARLDLPHKKRVSPQQSATTTSGHGSGGASIK
jgi:transposase